MENVFDKKLSHKIRTELAHHQEPFRLEDWEKMRAKLHAYQKTPQYWLKRSSGIICLLVMLFSFVRETSHTDYQFIQKAFYAINKTTHWWNYLKEKSDEIELAEQIALADNLCEQLPQETPSLSISNPTQIENLYLKKIPLKEVSLLESHKIEEAIPNHLNISENENHTLHHQPEEPEKIPTPSDKKGGLNSIFSLDSLLKSISSPPSSPHLTSTWRLSLVSKHIRNYQREATHTQNTYGFGVLFGKYFANHQLVLQTGAIYGKYVRSQINTELRREDKKINVDYFSLRGDFQLIDIPLTLQYNFKPLHPEYHFFVSSSLSSYLFVHEDVRKASLPSDLRRNFGTEIVYPTQSTKFGERIDWASSLTLSVGLEKKLSRYASLSVEPYVLIPLKGVGSESMKLNATGLMFKLHVQNSQYKR